MTRTTTDGRVERARRFTRAVLETSVGEARRGRLTIAFLTPDKPQVWDLNLVRVERVPRTGAARAVAREADELLGAAGMTHRRVLVDDEEIGVELTGGLEALGWTPEVHAVLAWEGGDPPPAPRARIVSTDEATPAYRAKHEGYGFTKDTIAQLVAYSVEEPGPGGPRLRRVAASEAPGDRIAAICNLFDDGSTAEIDDVATLPGFQRQGLATELMHEAIAGAREAGCDLVFLRADENDWPVEWYRRLGFRPIGRQYVFSRS